MKHLVALYDALDRTTSTNAKVAALAAYFETAEPADAAWAVFFLTGRRFKRLVAARHLATLAMELLAIPEWLLVECYGAVGDYAETVALLLDNLERTGDEDLPLHQWIEERILPVRALSDEVQAAQVAAWMRALDTPGRYLLAKLLTGELRVGVSQTLVVRGLAQATGLPVETLAHRLMGAWEPSAAFYLALTRRDRGEHDATRPYPFCLASPLEGAPAALGAVDAWQVEWKWDGIRCQLLRRDGAVVLWSRGEELITERFPEVAEAARALPDGTVLDGEVLAWDLARGAPLPFQALQTRIGRKKLSAKILAEAPAVFMAYDLLEWSGADVRAAPLAVRRARLESALAAVQQERLLASPLVVEPDWDALARRRAEARARRVEGFMLKRRSAPYAAGRKKGDWWKWKIAPLSLDVVLLYAQTGSGKRASLFTDYTFGLWSGGELVPFAKAYSGLSNDEIAELDRWIRSHTRERHGPVRAVEPVQVFELGFENIAPSGRHRSGVAVRFPRMLRWRRDKRPDEADTLERARDLLAVVQG